RSGRGEPQRERGQTHHGPGEVGLDDGTHPEGRRVLPGGEQGHPGRVDGEEGAHAEEESVVDPEEPAERAGQCQVGERVDAGDGGVEAEEAAQHGLRHGGAGERGELGRGHGASLSVGAVAVSGGRVPGRSAPARNPVRPRWRRGGGAVDYPRGNGAGGRARPAAGAVRGWSGRDRLTACVGTWERRGVSERRAAPTVGQVVLGRRLKELREAAGLGREEAARVLRVAPATVRRMETADVALKVPYVQILLDAYGVPEQEAVTFVELVEEANRPGWWQRFHDVLPEWFSLYVSLEGAARVIRSYEPHFVPGLLQTEDYARAVLEAGTIGTAGPEAVERHVSLR